MNCAIQGVRLIWKQKIWLAICEFLLCDFPVNQFKFKFLPSTSIFFIQFQVFALNFNFLHCLGLIDMLSADQHGEMFACILLVSVDFTLSNVRQFYLSMGNPSGVKELTTSLMAAWFFCFLCFTLSARFTGSYTKGGTRIMAHSQFLTYKTQGLRKFTLFYHE